ncbi:hypothetical protein ACFWCF_06320 [Rhodococcus sp. NPDC060090]|uniref:hypothetical protein n=1 Tax=Rhodococcus sp. NPDC060090 TaxID=3347056 RepID=UPI00364E81E3
MNNSYGGAGNAPSPAAIAETLALVGDKRVRALIYNVQTEGEVTANLPENTDYMAWLRATAQSWPTR